MKKFLALVLTLAMVLTLNVGMIVSAAAPAEAPVVDVTGKATVTVDGVEYTVIDDLAAVSTKGNYILSKDVAIANDAVITFAAGTVLHGNGYVISITGNSAQAPATAAPFVLGAGEAITISNVSFGTAAAPILLMSVKPTQEGEEQADISLFANDVDPTPEYEGELAEGEEPPVLDPVPTTTATFENVDFAVFMSDRNQANVGGFMAVAYGNYTFKNCDMSCTIMAGDMSAADGTDLVAGYVGGYFGRTMPDGYAYFENCTTTAGSSITNDWRTGGFCARMEGGVKFVNCTNNAVVENLTKITGGFVGWIEGDTLSSFTFDGNVNNGDITAYEGPKTSADKVHGDSSRLAAGLIGNIYTDDDNSAPQIIVSNCVNNGLISGENQISGMLGMIRIYGTQNKIGEEVTTNSDGTTKVTEIFEYINDKPVLIQNCVNKGDVVCNVKDAKASAHVMGGFFCRMWGPTEFEGMNINYGTVNGNGQKDAHLGGFVGNLSNGKTIMDNFETSYKFNGCVNYGAVLNGRRLGGIAGTAESASTFNGCVNFGWIDCGVSNAEIAGGINGFADNALIEYIDCLNVGEIHGSTYGGGIMGYARANLDAVIYMENCVNLADVYTSSQEAGGIAGYSKPSITILDCVNAGTVYADSTWAGQILGNADAAATITIGGCLAYGAVSADALPPQHDGLFSFQCFNEITLAEGYTKAGSVLGAVTLDTNESVTLDAALAALKTLMGEDAPLFALDDKVTCVLPQVRGFQLAREAKDGKTTVRFAGVVDAREYEKVQYTYKVNDGTATTVDGFKMDSINAVNRSGNAETRNALWLSGAELYVVEIADVATTGTVTIEITMTATSNGVAYASQTYTVTIVDGQVA